MATTPSRMISPYRVLACGGRSFRDRAFVHAALDALRAECGGVDLLMTGGADVAYRLAGEWAKDRGVPLCLYIATWAFHGPPAGPIRNGDMLKFGKPDLVIAFPGGAGTFDMVQRAGLAGVPVREVG